MADKKISQLTAASTPLAGTEVLPIVQSSTTVKVAANDLTVKNVRSNATTGILQIAGPAAAATRTMTVPDANFTAARTDAANSFAGDQTLSNGNLVIGTVAKGVDFSANANAAGMTSEVLNWYETGTFTPSFSGTSAGFTSITFTRQNGYYTRIGPVVYVSLDLVVSALTAGSPSGDLLITDLPFTVGNSVFNAATISTAGGFTSNQPCVGQFRGGTTQMRIYYRTAANGAVSAMGVAELGSTSTIVLSGFYFV